MSVENRIDYIKYVIEGLRNCSYLTGPEFAQIGMTEMIDSWKDEKFPYIQIQPVRNGDKGYGDSERFLDADFEIAVQGFLRRPSDRATDEDMYNILRFEAEVRDIIFQLHTDITTGKVVIPTFEQLGGFSDSFYDHETFEKTTTFLFNFVGKFYNFDQS